MQTFPRKPSVLFVKTPHVHTVLQSVAVQVRAGFCPFHVFVHKCISSRMSVKVPSVNFHQSPASVFRLSGSRGIQPRSISVSTTLDMGPLASLQRHLVNRSVERTRFRAFQTGWCSSLLSSQKRSHQEKMQRRDTFTSFPRCPAVRCLWLRVLRRLLPPPAASMPKSRAASATGMQASRFATRLGAPGRHHPHCSPQTRS